MIVHIDITSDNPVREVPASMEDHRTGDEFAAALKAHREAAKARETAPDYKPWYSVFNDRYRKHDAWFRAVRTKDFGSVDEDMVLGEMYYVLDKLLDQSRHYSPDDRKPRTARQWDICVDKWIKAKGKKMASLLPSAQHPELHVALSNTQSPLLNKVRDEIRPTFCFITDLRRSPLTEEEQFRLCVPLLATQEIFDSACRRLRAFGYQTSLDECDPFLDELATDEDPQAINAEELPHERPPDTSSKLLGRTGKLIPDTRRPFHPHVGQSSCVQSTSPQPFTLDTEAQATPLPVANPSELAQAPPIPSEDDQMDGDLARDAEASALSRPTSPQQNNASSASVDKKVPFFNSSPESKRERKSSEASTTASTVATSTDSSGSDSNKPVTPPGGGSHVVPLQPTSPESVRARGMAMEPVMEEKPEDERAERG